jgi:hypothetical protein
MEFQPSPDSSSLYRRATKLQRKSAIKNGRTSGDNDSDSLIILLSVCNILICCLKLLLLAFEPAAVQRKNGKAADEVVFANV